MTARSTTLDNNSSTAARCLLAQTLLHWLPDLSQQNRFMLPRMALLLVANLTDIDWVGQQFV